MAIGLQAGLGSVLMQVTNSQKPQDDALLLPDNILTSLAPHPHLMHLPRRDINARPRSKRLFRWIGIPGIRDGERPPPDEMRRHPCVGVWWIMRVAIELFVNP